MKIIIRKEKGVVIDYAETIVSVNNGLLCNGVVYGEKDLEVIETDAEIVPYKNTIINGIVGINPEWEASIDKAKQDAIDDYTLELIEGGLL